MQKIRTIPTLALALGLLVSAAVAAAAQDAGEAPTSGYFTGSAGQPAEIQPPTVEEEVPGGRQMEGVRFIDIPVEASDARISGLMSVASNGTGVPRDGGFSNIVSGRFRIVNDAGSWEGVGTSVFAVRDEQPVVDHETVQLIGQGAYEGLHAVLLWDFMGAEPVLHGVISELALASTPEVIAAS